MKGISVIICCYNSGKKLVPTLTHLAKQQVMPEIEYEVILVDNNCTDDTIETAKTTWLYLDAPFPLMVVQQLIPGLTYARGMGIQTARFDYIILCDDDNWLCDDYLSKVYHLFEAMPTVGLIGGIGEAVLETVAPAWFTRLNGYGYAIGAEGRETGYVDAVYGAGMSLRKSIYTSFVTAGFKFILSDRSETIISSGGDTEICMLVKNTGYQIYFNHTLTFKHFLTADRLNWKYYLKLRRSFGKATAYLQAYNISQNTSEQLNDKNKVKKKLSLVKFGICHFPYLLFPTHFKNTNCANFVQEMSMRVTSILEQDKINIALKLVTGTLRKKYLSGNTDNA